MLSFCSLLLVAAALAVGTATAAPTRIALVTGSTGVLGACLVRELAARGYHVHAMHRDHHKAKAMMQTVPITLAHAVTLRYCDLFQHQLALSDFEGDEVVLVNNAAVCWPGSTPTVRSNTLHVNVVAPTRLARQLIARMDERRSRGTIINVSSGDGELVNLHSALSEAIRNLNSLEELLTFVTDLQQRLEWGLEYAVGPTPMYSLSKALLNRATQLLHVRHPHVRTVACCPGNFRSPMSGADDQEGIRSADEAAWEVTSLLDEGLPAGRFYRGGREISW